MAVRKMLAGFAVPALGVCVVAPVANAASLCGRKGCRDEVAARGLSGTATSTEAGPSSRRSLHRRSHRDGAK